MISEAEIKLRQAAVAAFLKGVPVASLMELERFGGPACGAAGSIVRKWPAEGVVHRLPAPGVPVGPVEHPSDRYFRLRFVRNGNRSEIHVTEKVAVRWSGLDRPGDDLHVKRADGHWDVVHGVDGWVIYTATRERIVVGDVERDVARIEAERRMARRSL